jgi:hypothetical protein
MKKAVMAVVLVLGLTGCVTTPTPAGKAIPAPADRVYLHQQKPAGEFGTLVVTRDTGYAGSFCFVGVYVGGQLAAKLNPGETTTFLLPKGEVIIGVGGAGGAGTCGLENGFRRESAAIVNSGEIKKYRIVIRPGDGAAIEPTTL